MRDSLFYTDEELQEYDNYTVQNDTEKMELFLEDCSDFMKDIVALSTSLNEDDINNLNINLDINILINTIKELKEYKNNLNLNDDNRRYVNRKFDELKKELVILKNKHIQVYNSKVDYINDRINSLVNKLNRDILSNNVNNLLDKLNFINKCDSYIDGKWDQNVYLETLDYNKLIELYSNVSEIERILKIKTNEPLELFSEWNYINKSIKRIEKRIKNEDLSLSNINSNLDMCVTLLERVTDLDIKHELMRDKLSKEMFSKYSSKIVKLRSDIQDIESKLLDKKNSLVKKSNYYVEIVNGLDQISSKYDMLNRKVLEYNGKCTADTISIFNNYLDNLADEMEILNKIKEYDEKGMLNQEQKNNIYNKLAEITEKHKNINIKSNDDPEILKNEEEVKKHNDNKYSKFIKLLDKLECKVSKLDDRVKDKDVRKKMSLMIKKCDEYIDGFDHLLEYYKINDSAKYEDTKIEVDKLKDRYNNVLNNYYGKCPLRVKTVRSIKEVYKEHPKLGLISAGLSTLALLISANSLIPAIMYGNVIVGKSVPLLKSMTSIFNKILGGFIGAKSTIYGGWKLASGALLNASTATTALLKSLAIFSAGIVTFASPMFVPKLILKIKALVDKIKSFELKEKLVQNYEKGKEKVIYTGNKVRNKVVETKESIDNKREEKEIKLYYEELYDKYNEYQLTLDEFCVKYKLLDSDKRVLELMDEEEKLKDLRQQELRKIIKEKTNSGRRK